MDNRIDYLEKLKDDLIEQFKNQPNITVFNKALARQLEEVFDFFNDLQTLRWLHSAEGAQLDGIGDIAVLSRAEAFALARTANQNVPMDDETYRLYLAWKIALNTTNCTNRDVYRALRMFWHTPLYYSEKIEHPATIFFTTPALSPDDNIALLKTAPKVKAAGVALKIIANVETRFETFVLNIGGAVTGCVSTTSLPPIQ